MCSKLDLLFKTNYVNDVFKPVHCQPQALPLTKTTSSKGSSSKSLNTSTNNTQISCRMRYSQQVQTYGTTKSSTSYAKKTCRIGGPTFSY
jgi:hypothetical protein